MLKLSIRTLTSAFHPFLTSRAVSPLTETGHWLCRGGCGLRWTRAEAMRIAAKSVKIGWRRGFAAFLAQGEDRRNPLAAPLLPA